MKQNEAVTITQFLEARIAEDEKLARAATPGPWTLYDRGVGWEIPELPEVHDGLTFSKADAHYVASHDPSRVLAEVSAKRAVLASLWVVGASSLKGDPVRSGMYSALSDVAMDLAAIYKDHPDYQQEWSE